MGNRCVITTACADARSSDNIGVYLHWNGGRDSVEAFLAYCKLKEFRPPEVDNYGWARLCQVAGNYFGGGLSIGIDRCDRLDCENWNNGVYIIKDWEIVDRQYHTGREQQVYDLGEMLDEINKSQPEAEQLEQSVIDAYCRQALGQEGRTYRAELGDPASPDRMEVFRADNDVDALQQANEYATGDVVLLELHELDDDYNVIRAVDLPDRGKEPAIAEGQKPTLQETLAKNADKSKAQFGDAAPAKIKDKGEPGL